MARRPRPEPLTPAERAFDLGAWLRANASTVSARGTEWVIRCPRCGSEKCAVNIARKAWQCFSAGCGFRGWTPSQLVAAIGEMDLAAAAAVIGAWAGHRDAGPVGALAVPEPPLAMPIFPDAPLPPGYVRGLAPVQAAYAAFRRVPDAHVAAFGLGSVLGDGSGSKADRCLRGRVLFPTWMDGRVVFWTARATDGHPAKVMNLPRACSSLEEHGTKCACAHDEWGLRPTPGCATPVDVVMGAHLVRPGDRIIVVEGPVDAVVGGPGFVSLLGSVVHPGQVAAVMATRPSLVVVMLDGDAAGWGGASGVAAAFAPHVETRVAWMQPGQDPADVGRDACLRLADSAKSSDSMPPLTRASMEPRHRARFPMIEALD